MVTGMRLGNGAFRMKYELSNRTRLPIVAYNEKQVKPSGVIGYHEYQDLL